MLGTGPDERRKSYLLFFIMANIKNGKYAISREREKERCECIAVVDTKSNQINI